MIAHSRTEVMMLFSLAGEEMTIQIEARDTTHKKAPLFTKIIEKRHPLRLRVGRAYYWMEFGCGSMSKASKRVPQLSTLPGDPLKIGRIGQNRRGRDKKVSDHMGGSTTYEPFLKTCPPF